jgi:hypothetical protein
MLIQSSSLDNEPISTVANDVIVNYRHDGQDYQEQIFTENSDSVLKYGRQDKVIDLNLVNGHDVAQAYLDRFIDVYKEPFLTLDCKLFMPDGFQLENGDRILIPYFMDKTEPVSGSVLSISSEFGQGKAGKINMFGLKMIVQGHGINPELSEFLAVDDETIAFIIG